MKTTLFLIASLLASSFSQAAEILYSQHRDADSFKRISEHLSGKENKGRYAIARSEPTQRDGYYVALKFEKSDQVGKATSLRIQYVKPGSMEILSQTLPIEPIRKKRILVGLTNGIWAQSDSIPMAWKIQFIDTQGNTLFQSQSFLWSPKSS